MKQQGSENMWWCMVAKHLDETQLALVNAIARNVDDPTLLHAFEDTVRQAQAILLEILHAKGLLQAPSAIPQPGGSPRPPQFRQGQAGSGHGSPGAWAPQFPQPPQEAGSGHGSPGAWAPQFSQAPQPPPSFPQAPQPPPSFSQQGPQMSSPPPWIPDFSQLSSIPPPPYEPPPQEARAEAASPETAEVAPPETAVADDPQPEVPPIVPEASSSANSEAEADHPVS
jgi:hypothetical protein